MKYIGRENLGEALHVALRKGCDSAPTTAAHICIGLMPDSLWEEYVKIAGRYLDSAQRKGVLTEENAWEHLLYLSTQESSAEYRALSDAHRSAMRNWIGGGRTGNKPVAPKPFEPASEVYYDPGACFAADRLSSEQNPTAWLTELRAPLLHPGSSVDDIMRVRDRWRYMFRSILRTFTDDDWRGFACFLYYS